MKNHLKDHRGRKLVPLRLDRQTILLVTPDKATPEYAAYYLRRTEELRRIALHLN